MKQRTFISQSLNFRILGVLLICIFSFSCQQEKKANEKLGKNRSIHQDTNASIVNHVNDHYADAQLWIKSMTLFKPISIQNKPLNEEDSAKYQLGKLLYFDPRLSKNNTQSCNTCHNLETYGVDNEPTSLGDNGKRGGRNSPTSLNAFLHTKQFWDGRAPDVEAQAKGPILNPLEMGMPNSIEVENKIKSIPTYASLFREAFPESKTPINYDNLANAIGYFERSLSTPSKFDQYLLDPSLELNPLEKEGLKNFITIGCANCHSGIGLGGNSFRKFGEKHDYWPVTKSKNIDKGVYDLTKKESDLHTFKVPSLRNVVVSGPYFHDGSINNLSEAINIMAYTQLDRTLSPQENKSLIAFLNTLTGKVPEKARVF